MEEITTSGTIQQNDSQAQQQIQEPKTFTQEEVNRIVQERLARAKTAAGPSEKELELQQRETALYVREQITEKGLPGELIDDLKGLDKETVDKCIKIITPYIKEPFLNPVGPANNGSNNTISSLRAAMGLR